MSGGGAGGPPTDAGRSTGGRRIAPFLSTSSTGDRPWNRSPPRPTGDRRAPSTTALLFLGSALAYLLALSAFVAVTSLLQAAGMGVTIPSSFYDSRDLMALFGWVGMTISGVSIIIVPNHVGVPVRPRLVPRIHLVLANIGIAGFFASSLVLPSSPVGPVLLAVAAASFLAFGIAVLGTVVPFLRTSPTLGPQPRSARDATEVVD